MSPYGGDPVRGFDDSDGALNARAQFFRGGEAKVEVVETSTSGNLAVLVVIERQHGTIGDLPEQDWSLRVTWVFRRTAESDWQLVHRHADGLVHAIDHERVGVLARGQFPHPPSCTQSSGSVPCAPAVGCGRYARAPRRRARVRGGAGKLVRRQASRGTS